MISDTATEAASNFLGLTVDPVIDDEVGPQPKTFREPLMTVQSHIGGEERMDCRGRIFLSIRIAFHSLRGLRKSSGR